MLRKKIEKKLFAIFDPIYLNVCNESYQHNVPIGSESHFKVILVSNLFIGKSNLIRHRWVYNILSDEFKDGVYALALHTYTLKEWEIQEKKVPTSTRCCNLP